MAYTPHEWQNDELITAAKLNNIEEGIAAGGSGGGWDAVIRLTHSNDTAQDQLSALTPSIISGTFDQLYSILNNGGVPRILVEYVNPGIRSFHTGLTANIIYFSSEAIAIVIVGFSFVSGTYKIFTENSAYTWSPTNTITL